VQIVQAQHSLEKNQALVAKTIVRDRQPELGSRGEGVGALS
jgi:hypothetical protein